MQLSFRQPQADQADCSTLGDAFDLIETPAGQLVSMGAPARAEAVARFGKRRTNQRLQDLQQGLLNQTVGHGRDAQFLLAAPGFGNLHPAYWRRPVASRLQFFPYPGPVRVTRALDLPLLTPRALLPRRPFRRQARSPHVRARSLPAQPPDLRHFALTTRASWFVARSPCSPAPRIRFLFIGARFRSTLPLHTRSPACSCASFAVVSSWEDFHLQDRAHAGRTTKRPAVRGLSLFIAVLCQTSDHSHSIISCACKPA